LSLFAITENEGVLPSWEETNEGWTIGLNGKNHVISMQNGEFNLTDGSKEIII
jgi:hypothetical protein